MNWPTVRLDQCARVVGGATPSTSVAENWDGDVNWVTPKDISELDGPYIAETPRKLTSKGLASCAAEILPPDSVLFSSRAPIGHVAITKAPMATNQGFKSLVPDKTLADAGYLYWWLRAHRSFMESLGNGATFKEVSKAVVSRVEVPLPPLDEQRRIAAILDQADTLRQKRREQLALIELYPAALFEQRFGSNASLPNELLKDVCEMITDGTHYTPTYADMGVIFLSAKNVIRGRIDWHNIKYIPQSLHVDLQKRVSPRVGDVLLAKNGTTGVAAVVDRDEIFDIYVSLALLRPSPNLLPEFLCSALNAPSSKRQFDRSLKGIGVSNLHLVDIRNAGIPLPSLDEQAAFVDELRATNGVRAEIVKAAEEQDRLFASLQNRAFAGKL